MRSSVVVVGTLVCAVLLPLPATTEARPDDPPALTAIARPERGTVKLKVTFEAAGLADAES